MIDLAEVKPSVMNWLLVGFMALTFITLGKWAFTRWKVPGVSTLFLAA